MKAISDFFTPAKKQSYRIEGKVEYFIDVTETKGRLPQNTCSVAVRAYSNKEKTLQLPLKIKWYKLQAERNYEIEELENKDNFDFSAMDIGGEIKASIRSMDDGHKGTASLIFGPIRFDDSLRQPLESVLMSGFSKFNVLVQDDQATGSDKIQPISVFMSPNQVKFFYHTETEEESFFIEVTNERPRLQVVHTESENLMIYFDDIGIEGDAKLRRKIYQETGDAQIMMGSNHFSERYCVHLKFFSRNSRDIFITAIRLFRIVPVVTLSNLFRQLDVLLRENRLFEGNSNVTLNELLVEYDLLRTNLLSTIEYAKDLDIDREELQKCVTVLERDLEHTMAEFRKYIEENMRGVASKDRSMHSKNDMSLGIKKLEDLNASLISNRGDMKTFIKKKLDETMNDVQDKALRRPGAGVDMEKLKTELDRMTKLNGVYVKKIKELQDDKNKRKAKVSRALKDMNEHMNNVSREVTNFNELTQGIKDTSRMQSQMFDMSGIESKNDEDDMFQSNPFSTFTESKFMQKKKAPTVGESKASALFKIDEAEPDNEKTPAVNFNQLKVKEDEIASLKKRIRDLEMTIVDQQTRMNNSTAKRSTNQSMDAESTGSKVAELTKEIELLKASETELKAEAGKSQRFIEEFRALMKAMVSDEESTLKAPMNSSLIDESLMNGVFKVNLNTKLKMINIENDNLKKRITTLTREVFLLREENKHLKTHDTKNTEQFSTFGGLPAGAVTKDEHEEVKRQLDSVCIENDNLRNLMNKMREQDQKLNVNETMEGLRKELTQLASVNQKLLCQKLELTKKNEYLKNEFSDRKEDKRSEEEDAKQQMIIEQMRMTNERLMSEIVRLEEKILQYDEAKQSFISDMNDSYMSQSLRGNVSTRFK